MADLEARVAVLEAALAASQREMQDLVFTVSHDLRAPLRHIVSYAQLVRDEAGAALDAEALGFLDTVTGSAKQLGTMLDGLLELSRIGTATLHVDAVDLNPLVAEVVRDQQALALGHAIDWQVQPGLPAVKADAVLLRLALQQALANAVKFTRHTGQAQIAVEAEFTAYGEVALSVRDNGAGFNPALASKLFQPFQRMHSAKQFEGQGMGLAKVRKALARMDATVQLESLPAGGASLIMVLQKA
jgi:light-regulated signal transduction histidine kinase (bacteriophytochrome)